MAYEDNTVYGKYLNKTGCGCNEGCDDGCNDGCGCKEECSCCPPGLVGVYTDDGVHAGCLTPSDAELYTARVTKCPDGYIKLLSPEGVFLGCVTPEEYLKLNQPK